MWRPSHYNGTRTGGLKGMSIPYFAMHSREQWTSQHTLRNEDHHYPLWYPLLGYYIPPRSWGIRDPFPNRTFGHCRRRVLSCPTRCHRDTAQGTRRWTRGGHCEADRSRTQSAEDMVRRCRLDLIRGRGDRRYSEGQCKFCSLRKSCN
jgi:hypothetical protein